MPFLAPLIPALVGGAASAAGGAIVNGVAGALGGGSKGTPQAAQIDKSINTQQVQDANQDAYGAQSQQQQLANQLSAQGGIQNQSSVFNQLQNVANGQGPNPAQAMLANATGQNAANQAALMAGQRGASSNTGLIARQAAQQGGALQQNAAGQAAALQANQSLGALNQLSGIAGQQVSQQTGAIGNLNQFAQSRAGQLQQGLQGQNALATGQQGNINSINAQNQQQQNQQNQQNMQGIASGLGSAISSGVGSAMGATPAAGRPRTAADVGPSRSNGMFAQGGMIDSIGKENYKGRSKIGAHLMAKGGKINMESGGHVPGKPEVSGARDSYANDKVKALLSPGEIVLPRSVTMSSDPITAAAKFVAAIKAKKDK